MGEARKVASVASDDSEEQKGGCSGSTKRETNSPLCHTDGHLSSQKMRSWNQNTRRKKDESCSDIVKDDSGAYAAFAEQGSSASQMTAARVMDIIARLPGCAGQEADAVSDYTQVKMEDAPNYWSFRSQNVQMHGYVFDTSGRNHGQALKIQWFFLKEI